MGTDMELLSPYYPFSDEELLYVISCSLTSLDVFNLVFYFSKVDLYFLRSPLRSTSGMEDSPFSWLDFRCFEILGFVSNVGLKLSVENRLSCTLLRY